MSKPARADDVLPLPEGAPEAFRSVSPGLLWQRAPQRIRVLISGAWLLSVKLYAAKQQGRNRIVVAA